MTGPTGGADGALTGAFTEKAYQDVMALVGETVSYLEAQGTVDRAGMDGQGRTVFAAESMRLTTRLMQLVSWFMVQRAIISGEMTQEEARLPSRRLGAVDVCLGPGMAGSEALPPGLLDLLARSRSLFEQVHRIETMIQQKAGQTQSPVHDLMDRLKP